MKLTPEQRRQMVALRQRYLLAVRDLVRERSALNAVIQCTTPRCAANPDAVSELSKVRLLGAL